MGGVFSGLANRLATVYLHNVQEDYQLRVGIHYQNAGIKWSLKISRDFLSKLLQCAVVDSERLC